MLYFYQHLPEYFSPMIFSIGNFHVRWYSIMYLIGFLMVYVLLVYRAKRKELEIGTSLEIKNSIFDFLIYSFIGLIIGARLGQILFYDFGYYLQNSLAVINPFDSNGNFVGIFGMSYFGGLIGVIIASFFFCKTKKINLWKWLDFVTPAVPAGYFFGRIGNFLNGELFGKITDRHWGMYFRDGLLRHPTQIYESLAEGLLLFVVLWSMRNKSKFSGHLVLVYLVSYGIIRFFVEFLREPEGDLIFGLSRGQILSLTLIISAGIVYFYKKRE